MDRPKIECAGVAAGAKMLVLDGSLLIPNTKRPAPAYAELGREDAFAFTASRRNGSEINLKRDNGIPPQVRFIVTANSDRQA
jgi:hypothetical protein